MERISSTTTRPAVSLTAARLSILLSVTALVLLAALHLLSPEFDPAWRMVSEYALGDYRWVLALMFLAWALSAVTLFFALQSQVQTVGGKIGLGFLLVSALGMGLAILFPMPDPRHGLATLVGIPTFPIAALLTSARLSRDPNWSAARRPLLWAANLTWISLVVMFAALFTGLSQSGGQFGPGVLIGWPNRLVVVAYTAWLMTAARYAEKL